MSPPRDNNGTWLIGSVIGGVIGIAVVVVIALWTIVTNENANNKAIADDLKSNYVTNSRYHDLENRLSREIQRVSDDHNRFTTDLRRAHDDNLPRSEFSVWKDERTKTIDRLINDQDKMTTKAEQAMRDRASVDVMNALQRQLDEISKRVDAIATREDQRHIGTGGIRTDR